MSWWLEKRWRQESVSLSIPNCGARFSNQGQLVWFTNSHSCCKSDQSPVETGDLKVGIRSRGVVLISCIEETDWSKVSTCLYRCWSHCWDGSQVIPFLEQVAKLCEEQGREDLQLLWRIAQHGWKVGNSTVWELFQQALASNAT